MHDSGIENSQRRFSLSDPVIASIADYIIARQSTTGRLLIDHGIIECYPLEPLSYDIANNRYAPRLPVRRRRIF